MAWQQLADFKSAGDPRLTVPILEVHFLDDLAHRQNVGRSAENIHSHPRITSIQGRNGQGSLCTLDLSTSIERMLDISPSSNYRAENHKPECEKSGCCDASSEPQNLSICSDNDGQVLEDRVDRDREELKGFGAGIDHTDEEKGDGEPCAG